MLENTINKENLYVEKNYTDLESGGIKVFEPVNVDGTYDLDRESKFVAITNIQTPQGVVPIHGSIEDATTLDDAIDKFQPTLDAILNKYAEEAEEAQKAQIESGTQECNTSDDGDTPPKLELIK